VIRDGYETITGTGAGFCSYLRHENRRIVGYETVFVTPKMDRGTSLFWKL
jgi:hypothetical protein